MIDFEKIRAIYKVGKELKIQDLQEVFKSTKSKSYASSEYLMEEGSLQKQVFFIKKGLIRSFAVNEKGEEITIELKWENQFTANSDIIFFDRPARLYFQALEQTETLSMDYDLLQSIVSKKPNLELYRKEILQRMLIDAHNRIESFVLYSPEERYLRYVQSHPGIVNRAPNKYIAHVLGITPVSLSRIRKRIASKKK